MDGWKRSDNNELFFHFVGEGPHGDQRMVRGNLAINHHVAEGISLELFDRGRELWRFQGTFRFVDSYEADAPDATAAELRTVIVFRLEGIDALEPDPMAASAVAPDHLVVEQVPVHDRSTESEAQWAGRPRPTSENIASDLVHTYASFVRRQGGQPIRLRSHPPGEVGRVIADVYDPDQGLLVVAKGTTSREAIRAGIGQLLDCRRFTDGDPRLALLLPLEPRADLVALLHSVDVTAIVPDGQGYREIAPRLGW